MKKYRIEKAKNTKRDWRLVFNTETKQYFAGYDFMGGVNWINEVSHDCYLTEDEAEYIVRDLESADAPAVKENDIILGGPELSFEISECRAALETIIEIIERKYPGWTFDRTEARYESCIMAIFTKN